MIRPTLVCLALLGVAGATRAQVECIAPVHYGNGTAGTYGLTPILTTGGKPAREGDPTFALHLSLARPLSPFGLGISLGPSVPLPFMGVELVIDFVALLGIVPAFTSSTGHYTFEMPIPAESGIAGFALHAQAYVADPEAVQGLAASGGIAMLICDLAPEINLRAANGIDASCASTFDSSCTNMQPPLPSHVDATRSSYDVTALRVDTNQRVTVTRVTGVGAAIAEDYESFDCELFVFESEADFASSGLDPANALHHDPDVTLVDSSPEAFGGQSPLGVTNRFLEFEFEDFEIGDALAPKTYWLVIVRENSGDDGLVWSHTLTDVGVDIRTDDAAAPNWTSLDTLGLSPGSAAADVWARPICASFQTDLAVVEQEVETWHRPNLHAAATALGTEVCAPLFIVEKPFMAGPPEVVLEAQDDAHSQCFGLDAQTLAAARAAVIAAADAQTDGGATSAWLCVVRIDGADALYLPLLLADQLCTPLF
ncbi:MAG: hypothetical protein KDB80_07250 [Planctomycetes bacterium]|nr:hypothetical protein [Planctomycetota bacterium]